MLTMSLAVVMKGPVATAGSTPTRCSINGIPEPAMAANRTTSSIARLSTADRLGSPLTSLEIR